MGGNDQLSTEGQGVFLAHSLVLTSGTLRLKRLREKGHSSTHRKQDGERVTKASSLEGYPVVIIYCCYLGSQHMTVTMY